jgi:O-antigen/teichoic acid export membrane protein
MHSILKQAWKGVFASYLLTIIKIVKKFFLVPMMISYMGASLYGVWLIIGEVMAYIRNIEGGLGWAIEQKIASVRWKNNINKINIIYTNGLIIFLSLSLLAIIIGMSFAPFFTLLFKIDPEYDSLITKVFFIGVLTTGLGFPLIVIQSLLRGIQEQAKEVKINMLNLIFSLILTIIVIRLNLSIISLAFVGLFLLPFKYIYSIHVLKKKVKGLFFSFTMFSKKISKELLTISVFAFINQFSSLIIFSTDAILIGRFIDTASVTIYILTFQLILTLAGFAHGLATQLQPGYAELTSQNNIKKISQIFLGTLKISMVFSSLIIPASYFMNSHFVSFWVGENFFGGKDLTFIFSLIAFYTTLRQHCNALLLSAGNLKFVAKWSFIEAVLNLVLSIILIQVLGLIGVALGTLISGIIVAIFLFIPKVLRKYNIPIFDMFSIVFLRPIFYSLPTFFFFWFILKYVFINKSLLSIISSGFLGAIFGITMIWLSLENKQKNIVFNFIKRE